MSRRSSSVRTSIRKAKGRDPFRDLAPYFRFFEDLVRLPDHKLWLLSESSGAYEQSPRFPYHSVSPLAVRAFSRHPLRRFPECCVSFISDSLASLGSDPLAVLVSVALPSSVAGSLPNLVADPLPEFLPWFPFGLRFRFPWSSFPGSLASSVTGSPMALVCSLLLENCSSVDSKDTRKKA